MQIQHKGMLTCGRLTSPDVFCSCTARCSACTRVCLSIGVCCDQWLFEEDCLCQLIFIYTTTEKERSVTFCRTNIKTSLIIWIWLFFPPRGLISLNTSISYLIEPLPVSTDADRHAVFRAESVRLPGGHCQHHHGKVEHEEGLNDFIKGMMSPQGLRVSSVAVTSSMTFFEIY